MRIEEDQRRFLSRAIAALLREPGPGAPQPKTLSFDTHRRVRYSATRKTIRRVEARARGKAQRAARKRNR